MKRLTCIIAIVVFTATGIDAQTKLNIGAGYFGHTLVHPGLIVEGEMEFGATDAASIPLRISVGSFVHNRNQYGIFLDAGIGFRQYFKSGIFLEENVGVGLIESLLHSDAVYQVDENGNISEGSRWMPLDLMPSLTLGLGYNLTQGSDMRNLVWMRPKIYWQSPHKNSSTFALALQLGYTHTISLKN